MEAWCGNSLRARASSLYSLFFLHMFQEHQKLTCKLLKVGHSTKLWVPLGVDNLPHTSPNIAKSKSFIHHYRHLVLHVPGESRSPHAQENVRVVHSSKPWPLVVGEDGLWPAVQRVQVENLQVRVHQGGADVCSIYRWLTVWVIVLLPILPGKLRKISRRRLIL